MPNQAKEVNALNGLNLRQESADLQDSDSSKLVNLDPFRKPGTLELRKGRSTLQGVIISDPIIRTISKVNDNRYQVAGRTAYRDMAPIVARDTLDAEKETTIVPFRPLLDSHIWAFLADDALMFKDDGTNTYIWGIDLLPEPGPKVTNQTAKVFGDEIDEGSVTIAVTQIRMDLISPDLTRDVGD